MGALTARNINIQFRGIVQISRGSTIEGLHLLWKENCLVVHYSENADNREVTTSRGSTVLWTPHRDFIFVYHIIIAEKGSKTEFVKQT